MDAAVTLHVATANAVDPDPYPAFDAGLRGSVLRPGDEAVEAAAGVWNTALQRRPEAIVRVADAQDVRTAIAFACRNELEIAVRSGGHSIAGHSTGDGVLVADTRGLRGIHIDLEQGIVWAGAGLTAGELTTALGEHGMAVPFGDTASVGLGGITLGGGIGYLARMYGLTVDSLLAVEIVTADGQVRTVSATEHPDLFWALRGGGGNFGVVTRFCYRLSRVGHEVLGGALFMPGTRDVLRSLVPIATSAPDELTVIAALMAAPPAPFMPAEHVGAPTLVLLFVYAGDPADGHAAIAPFREVATPFAEVVQPMPYAGIYELSREVIQFHRATQPLTAALKHLNANESGEPDLEFQRHLRGIQDHLLRTTEQIEGFRELLSNILSVNLTMVSVRQNEQVQKVSSWAAILIVPTIIAGIYGMNFEYMPELSWIFGYPLSLLLMLAVSSLLYLRFKRSGWL